MASPTIRIIKLISNSPISTSQSQKFSDLIDDQHRDGKYVGTGLDEEMLALFSGMQHQADEGGHPIAVAFCL